MNVDAQALGRAVLNDDARAVSRSVSRSVLIECARAGRPSMAMMGKRRRCSWPSRMVMPDRVNARGNAVAVKRDEASA